MVVTDPHILKALIEVALFFEFADEQTVAPDAAVTAMEQIAANLQGVEARLKPGLVDQIQSLATGYLEHAEFVRDLPETFGLR
jgi:hypothetical protein